MPRVLGEDRAFFPKESVSGSTPAIWASYGGHLDTLQLLVSRGADIHRRDQLGYSSLLYAALYDRLPVCEYLLSLGADLMAASIHNYTALAHYGQCAHPRLSPETRPSASPPSRPGGPRAPTRRRCSGAATSARRGAVR